MVDYFVQHPHVAAGKFNSLHGNSDLRGSWEQLVADLNKMAKDGKTKDVKSWKAVKKLIYFSLKKCVKYYYNILEIIVNLKKLL